MDDDVKIAKHDHLFLNLLPCPCVKIDLFFGFSPRRTSVLKVKGEKNREGKYIYIYR